MKLRRRKHTEKRVEDRKPEANKTENRRNNNEVAIENKLNALSLPSWGLSQAPFASRWHGANTK
jgi:hypothetical protein